MILDFSQIVFGAMAVTVLGAVAVLVRTIDLEGFVVGIIIGFITLLFGGWKSFFILAAFFVTTAFFTHYKYEMKSQLGLAEEKRGLRTWRNVIANGSVASFFAVAYGISDFTPFALGYLGAISSATADTLATEVGLLNPYKPRLITDLSCQVTAGTSGAISPYGELAAVVGAGLVSSIGWSIGFPGLSNISGFFLVALAGLMGCTFDSLLGATIQALYCCTICRTMTEKKTHCNAPTEYVKKNSLIDNDVVNLLTTTFGALSAFLLYLFLYI